MNCLIFSEIVLANEISMQHLANLKKNSEQDVLQLLKAKLKEGEVEYLNEVIGYSSSSVKYIFIDEYK